MNELKQQQNSPVPTDKGAEMWRYAQALSKANIIPKTFQGHAANCFVAMDMANRLGVGVMEIMQNTYVVHGTPGFSARYTIAMCNNSGVFKGPICWTESGKGDDLSVTAYAYVAATGERVEYTVDMAMAKAEKWTTNPKYRTMPSLMLKYRSGSTLVKLYNPGCLLGMQTAEELEDMRHASAAPAVIEYAPQIEEAEEEKAPAVAASGGGEPELSDELERAADELFSTPPN